ncbi:MAG: LysE family transporter [Paludibacteraceae bacterium]|nr:LysE family transporter [Paludibacteraceae bacterium]
MAILCIQRTLLHGKYHGWVTGMGAAASDVFYSALALWGLSFVIDFIEANTMIIGIIGSLVITFFGIKIALSNPTSSLSSAKEEKKRNVSYMKDFTSAFGLTLTSNPAIILFFIPLFAQFHFAITGLTDYHFILALISIFIGASLWWFLVTSVANIFRSRFNIRGLKILNRVAGIALIGLAIVTFAATVLRCQ